MAEAKASRRARGPSGFFNLDAGKRKPGQIALFACFQRYSLNISESGRRKIEMKSITASLRQSEAVRGDFRFLRERVLLGISLGFVWDRARSCSAFSIPTIFLSSDNCLICKPNSPFPKSITAAYSRFYFSLGPRQYSYLSHRSA